MTLERDIEEEQALLDRAYHGLDAMRAEANRMLQSVLDLGRGGTFQSRTERDIVVRTSLARLAQLDIGDQALTFGRIDCQTGDSYHIGRVAVSGRDHEPLVVDWRAPVAEPFYRATGLDPQGLVRRRHLAVRGRTVVGLEDEVFGAPPADAPPSVGDLPVGGPGALLAALGAARTGQMADIVATIQREQDEIIRSPMAGVLLVQGGPGTGKTAVALHRAAYLLYTFRFPLERQGVLVVGPNPLFLRYIERVLPSLGETGVTLSTISGLVPEVRVQGVDDPGLARLKGEARMARVIARALRTRQRGLRRDLEAPFGAGVLHLSAEESAAIVALGRRRPGTHNARRRFVEQQVTSRLARQYERVHRRAGGDGTEAASERRELARQLRRIPEVASALDRMWPRLAPHELVHDLLGARPLLAAAGRGVLSDAEVRALGRPRSGSLDAVAWTAADAALVDEARALLGPLRPEDELRAYGHIVVDEAQDLSPMQLRMLARRSISGSMTVVGDVAQATGPWAPSGWDDVAVHLSPGRAPRLVELTAGYRTPAEVMAVAAGVLAVAAPGLTPPRPVRRAGMDPVVVRAGGPLGAAVADVARSEVAAAGGGRTAVLTPEPLHGEVVAALEAAGLDPVDPRGPGPGLGAPLVVLPAVESHGLEFDAVVVVEPSAIVGGSATGLRTLYVALTRPTRRLAVVHAEELPEPLVAGLAAVARV